MEGHFAALNVMFVFGYPSLAPSRCFLFHQLADGIHYAGVVVKEEDTQVWVSFAEQANWCVQKEAWWV